MAYLKARVYVDTTARTGYSTTTKVLIGGGVTALGVVGAIVAAPLVLAGVGFSAGGIAAGSMAAAWQASIGNVVAGSLFASLQSAGVVGLGAAGIGTAAAAGAVLGGTIGAITANGATKSIPVVKLQETFDIYDSDQDGYVSGDLEKILKDLEVNLTESELKEKFKKATGCYFNSSTPVSYEEFLALFGLKIYKDKELESILENLFLKVVKEKGRLISDDVKEMLTVLNVNTSEKYFEICIEGVLNGQSDKILNLKQFLKLFGLPKAES